MTEGERLRAMGAALMGTGKADAAAIKAGKWKESSSLMAGQNQNGEMLNKKKKKLNDLDLLMDLATVKKVTLHKGADATLKHGAKVKSIVRHGGSALKLGKK